MNNKNIKKFVDDAIELRNSFAEIPDEDLETLTAEEFGKCCNFFHQLNSFVPKGFGVNNRCL